MAAMEASFCYGGGERTSDNIGIRNLGASEPPAKSVSSDTMSASVGMDVISSQPLRISPDPRWPKSAGEKNHSGRTCGPAEIREYNCTPNSLANRTFK